MLLSIVLAVVVFCIVTAIETMFATDGKLPTVRKSKIDNGTRASADYDGMVKGAVLGIVVGLIYYFTPKISEVLWLAPIFLIAMLAVSGCIIYRWLQEGEDWKEVILFILLAAMVYSATMLPASMTTGLVEHEFLKSLIVLLPELVLVGTIGTAIASAFFFRKEEAESEENEKKARAMNVFGWVAVIVTLVLLFFLCYRGLAWGALGQVEINEDWIEHHNDVTAGDEDESNDMNFGPGLADGLEEDEAKELTAEDYHEDHIDRMGLDLEDPEDTADPALLTSNFLYSDAILGQRGSLAPIYAEAFVKYGDETLAINAVSDYVHSLSREEYALVADEFIARLESAKEIRVGVGKDIKDQMYMVQDLIDGIPNIVVFETEQDDGLFLEYVYEIKGQEVVVRYRTECGYQPTDVEESMGITPQANPNKPAPQPSRPTPTPTPPPPSNPKDPNEGTQGPLVGPNDDPGPGPDTNNGEGAWFSSEQEEDGSIFLPSYQEYEDIMDELEDINDTQREGGDDNTPTYTPPEDKYGTDVNVDSNAENGTGYGGIDVSTPVTPPAQTTGGESVTDDGPGEAWGGPPD